MPYANNDALPDAVKRLPVYKQNLWRNVFNSAFESKKYDEATCFKIAWAAVNKNKRVVG